eukprot:CAMPEP_0182863366 /NCGR_PEP_ID=MMETSP0034_2-20130328/6601_1 /TAXON_ID=156128 /ORGANISM="Nephroselmis pyriformis, Strain CCMP717" /LENGTH=98 /DNA_ID=CAMNT_0024995561 /DNA_START=44 /DNA_END=336 /DNA_ORIENTATION=+
MAAWVDAAGSLIGDEYDPERLEGVAAGAGAARSRSRLSIGLSKSPSPGSLSCKFGGKARIAKGLLVSTAEPESAALPRYPAAASVHGLPFLRAEGVGG